MMRYRNMVLDIDKQVNQFLKLFVKKYHCTSQEINLLDDVITPAESDIQWDSWCEKIGIYIIYDSDNIYYVGRSLSGTTFGKRIADHMNKDWFKKLDSATTNIGLYIFNQRDDFILPSLEIFLYDHFPPKPKYNDKRG